MSFQIHSSIYSASNQNVWSSIVDFCETVTVVYFVFFFCFKDGLDVEAKTYQYL